MQNQNQFQGQGQKSRTQGMQKDQSVNESSSDQAKKETGVGATQKNSMTASPSDKKSTAASGSIGDALTKDLDPELKENFDKIADDAKTYLESAKAYINESPKEALMVGATIAMAAYVLFNTKPGRQAFEKGSATFMPKFKEWLSENFGSAKNSTPTH